MKTKILYVEDEPFLARIVRESLESRDYEVILLEDGKNAVETFSKTNPDICIFDVMLPSRSGYEIAKGVRQVNSLIPIIFVTARTQTEDLLRGFESGGNDYIRKPFSMEELIARINNLLHLSRTTKRNGSFDVVQIGSFQYNPARYELKLGDSVRKLSHREAQLLTILSENRNGTVNRKEILLKLWGDDSFFNSRNLDVYITKLRDYLKDDPSIQIITIKGIGYHFATG